MIKKVTILLLSSVLSYSIAYADTSRESTMGIAQIEKNNHAIGQFSELINSYEREFQLVLSRKGTHNQRDVTLFRYEPSKHLNFDGVHSSFLINNKTESIQGFVRLLPDFESKKPQVSKEEAEKVMRQFTAKYAPDLLEDFKINWIDKHDETIIVDGNKTKLTGMKIKCRDSRTGLYFWIIVAPDSSVMVFERDVEWDFLKAGRQTEKWLHDSWLKKVEK